VETLAWAEQNNNTRIEVKRNGNQLYGGSNARLREKAMSSSSIRTKDYNSPLPKGTRYKTDCLGMLLDCNKGRSISIFSKIVFY
jgi:hypothetical protein